MFCAIVNFCLLSFAGLCSYMDSKETAPRRKVEITYEKDDFFNCKGENEIINWFNKTFKTNL